MRRQQPLLKLILFFVVIAFIGIICYENSIDYIEEEEEIELAAPIRTVQKHKMTIAKSNIDEKERIIQEQEGKHSSFDGIYVNDVYRVSDTQLRIIYLQYKDNNASIIAKVGRNWQKVSYFCYNSSCQDNLFCSIATRIGTIKIPSKTLEMKEISLSVKGNEEYFNVPVRDVRSKKNTFDHHVGVCLQPIFYSADWTIVVQFFESWLAQGASKFYFYYHSYTMQTSAVLEFYKAQLGVGLELIPWSDVPVHQMDKGDYERDPNTRIFRYAATAFMHDCALRSRGHVKYIANFDLDDFPVAKNGNIGETLDDMMNETTAAVIVDWKLSKQKLNWDSINTPADIFFDLDKVKIVANENIRLDYKISKKIFIRPERIVHYDMHNIFLTETDPETGHVYTTITASDTDELYLLHLRRFERHLIKNRIRADRNIDKHRLEELNQQMMHNYRKRIRNSAFANHSMNPWTLEAREIMRNLEQCRTEAFGTRLTGTNKLCQQSSAGCEQMLMTNVAFKRAPLTWIDIAHTAIFNEYIVKA